MNDQKTHVIPPFLTKEWTNNNQINTPIANLIIEKYFHKVKGIIYSIQFQNSPSDTIWLNIHGNIIQPDFDFMNSFLFQKIK